MNMAYSRGISAALALILGRVYIPVAATGARCVLGKLYMWLEYAAIGILTLSTVVFGYLKAFDITDDSSQSDGKLFAGLLVMASATTAAFNSLLTEKLLKDEQVEFHLQKIRLDIASSISALGLIPVIGAITTRVQDIPWVTRPVSDDCTNEICWDLDAGAGENPACDCEVSQGLFAGWTAEALPLIFLALSIGIAYNWLVGKLVQRFSTVHRCIADSFSLLLIYFVGDPLFNHTSLDDMCLNLVAFIVPLSSALFAVSAAEMEWAISAVTIIRESGGCLKPLIPPPEEEPVPSSGFRRDVEEIMRNSSVPGDSPEDEDNTFEESSSGDNSASASATSSFRIEDGDDIELRDIEALRLSPHRLFIGEPTQLTEVPFTPRDDRDDLDHSLV